jgi:NAD(P)-dependent dehydrogenase (short-subunit alcohol dehydrogenase family)
MHFLLRSFVEQEHLNSLTIPDSRWQDDSNTNFVSTVHLTAKHLPGMLERKCRAIVNICYGAAPTRPGGGMIHYSPAMGNECVE